MGGEGGGRAVWGDWGSGGTLWCAGRGASLRMGRCAAAEVGPQLTAGRRVAAAGEVGGARDFFVCNATAARTPLLRYGGATVGLIPPCSREPGIASYCQSYAINEYN